MKTACDEILSFVKVLAKEPGEITVTQIDGKPTVFYSEELQRGSFLFDVKCHCN